ncbi:hypothetical protein TNCV_262451 [Trichonephila clavipes]|nr:hypothetical protein TNCV_262451 [Trichonephila clavipes]
MESVPEPNEIGNLIEEVVDLARQINLEVDIDDVKELLNQELAIDGVIKMHQQDHNIKKLESVDSIQSADRMTVGNLISLVEKDYYFTNYKLRQRAYFFNKIRNKKKLLACLEEILREKKILRAGTQTTC